MALFRHPGIQLPLPTDRFGHTCRSHPDLMAPSIDAAALLLDLGQDCMGLASGSGNHGARGSERRGKSTGRRARRETTVGMPKARSHRPRKPRPRPPPPPPPDPPAMAPPPRPPFKRSRGRAPKVRPSMPKRLAGEEAEGAGVRFHAGGG